MRKKGIWKALTAVILITVLLLSACSAPAGERAEEMLSPDPEAERAEEAREGETSEEEKEPEAEEMPGEAQIPVRLLSAEEEEALSGASWQGNPVFPDWKGYTDDTLAMNSMYSFSFRHGQGRIYVRADPNVESFSLYVNGTWIPSDILTGGGLAEVDISSLTLNGTNTIQVTNILPASLSGAVEVRVPFPEVLEGRPEEEGISPQSLALISDLIEADIENGFPSAQLAVIRHGRLVYENAWGKTNACLPDGSPDTESPPVTTKTLYDLASVTKMFTVNYGLQRLLTEGKVDLDDRVTKYLGEEFVSETMLVPREDADGNIIPMDQLPDLETVKRWKGQLTIRGLLRHQGGMPGDPKYPCPKLYKENTPEEDFRDNPLFAGNGADAETREATLSMINRTPLEYEPGTRTLYSDADYMILGLIVEKITGRDLDTYIKETFCAPMGLTHITYNPLRNGFAKEDCAATELNGNTRDHLLHYEGYRDYTLQGEVHDEKAWYSMAGVSGHAGLFANASDLARLAFVMLEGGCGENRFFSRNVLDIFTGPKKEDAANWGLGWWRQGDGQRVWYFGTQAGHDTFGHQGWTGTLVTIDPGRDLVTVYLTNKINTRVTDKEKDANRFDGGWYTASTLGFVNQILSIGMDQDADLSDQLLALSADMALESLKLLPEGVGPDSDHPAARNARSKRQVFEKYLAGYDKKDRDRLTRLKESVDNAFSAGGEQER